MAVGIRPGRFPIANVDPVDDTCWKHSMPIFPISLADAAFGPTRTRAMGEAFERALKMFEIAPSEIAKEALANRIIEAACPR